MPVTDADRKRAHDAAIRAAEHRCQVCGARAGSWFTRIRKAPMIQTNLIDLGPRDPGPTWWDTVTTWWKVDDAPRKAQWTAPARVVLAVDPLDGDPGNTAPDNLQVRCQDCHRTLCPQPTLFDFHAEEPQ